MRRGLLAAGGLLLAVAALVLALGGTIFRTSREPGPASRASALGVPRTPSRPHPRPGAPVAAKLDPRVAPRPRGRGRAALDRALARALAPAGMGAGAYVYDLSARRALYAERPTVARPPASVEKLWTSVALLDRLRPSLRLHTALLGTGRVHGGTLHGDLFLRGGGDPTFGDALFNRVWNDSEGPTPTELAAALRRAGVRRIVGRLYPDDTLFDRLRGGLMTDYRPDTPDFGGYLSSLVYDHGTTAPHYSSPATFAAHMMALALRGDGIAVSAASRPRRTPARATLLAQVTSPPLEAMLRLMNVPSDDLFAELLAKQLGVLFGNGGSIAAGARVIAQTIAERYGLHPRIRDGSGLGRVDGTSPLQIVELLRDVWGTATGRRLAASLPIVGRQGTVQGVAVRTAAAGRCVAKTGTLDGVTNLAGDCTSRGGHTLAFGLFVDGPDNASGFAEEGAAIAAIARY